MCDCEFCVPRGEVKASRKRAHSPSASAEHMTLGRRRAEPYSAANPGGLGKVFGLAIVIRSTGHRCSSHVLDPRSGRTQAAGAQTGPRQRFANMSKNAERFHSRSRRDRGGGLGTRKESLPLIAVERALHAFYNWSWVRLHS
jgi:hypothetical protein